MNGCGPGDFDDFGNEAPAWPSFKMNDHIYRLSDVCLYGAVRQVYPALENAARESG